MTPSMHLDIDDDIAAPYAWPLGEDQKRAMYTLIDEDITALNARQGILTGCLFGALLWGGLGLLWSFLRH